MVKQFDVTRVEQVAKHIKDLKPDLDNIDELVVFKGLQGENIEQGLYRAMQSVGFTVDSRHFSVDGDLESSNWWSVIYDPKSPNAYAHSSTPQPLHCDNAWFSDPAEINLFFMKKQSPVGGANTVFPVDKIVGELELSNPKLLNDLTSIDVKIKKGDSSNERYGPIIGKSNNQYRIYWNYYRTERSTPIIQHMIEEFFLFLQACDERGMVTRNRAETGDVFFFNDSRVLHGRDAFEAQNFGDRILLQSMWKL